jgi:hypothetical protein
VSDWIALGVLGASLLLLGYLGRQGARSPLRPLSIPIPAWQFALTGWRTNPRVLAAVSAVVALGAAAQLYFVNTSGHDEVTLLIASIVWQACAAALAAAVAVPLHLFVIHAFLRARDIDPPGGRRNVAALMRRAAAFGAAIWIVGYLLGIAFKSVLLAVEAPLREMGVVSLAVVAGLQFVSFLLTSLLALVRPALSLGLARPLRTGVRMAVRHARALYVLLAVLGILPLLLEFLMAYMPSELISSVAVAHLLSVLLLSMLNIFQFFTLEVGTVLFARHAMLWARAQADRAAELGAELPSPSAP